MRINDCFEQLNPMFFRLAFFAAAFAAVLPVLVHAQSAQTVFARVSPSIVVIKTSATQGSGVAVLVFAEGFGKATLIATNCHVVKGETFVRVTHKTTEGVGFVTVCDEVRDIALVRVSGEIPVVEKRNALSLSVGETVFAVGAPRGLELSITNGLVSQLRVTEAGQAPMIQTTAPISPGSSGGGLFDAQGRLIGLTTYMLRESQGLNFALPSEWIALAMFRGNASNFAKETNKPTAVQLPETDKNPKERATKADALAHSQKEAYPSAQDRAARNRGLADYVTQIRNKVRSNIAYTQEIIGHHEAIFEIAQLPSGSVTRVQLRKSSGTKALDESIELAIHKSSPLPKPENSDLFQPTLILQMTPNK
jgi:TonB family protein